MMTTNKTSDFLIIGGGVIGVCLALEARRRHPASRVTVIEKEKNCGEHASGRNSGVLHAGFYYTADSLKARFTREGNSAMTAYCQERGLRINRCGKLVVAKNEQELDGLAELLRRGTVNGVELREVTEREAREIEPRVKTCDKALFSPTTSSVDPTEVMRALVQDARNAGIDIRTDTSYLGRDGSGVRTSRGSLPAGYVVNAAGLYADRIAADFGFSRDYRIIPFKGLYLYADEPVGAIRTHIYPVPDLRNPFLGVHFTVTAHGKIKIGPTAIPAFWREHYSGLRNFRLGELAEIVTQEMRLWWRNEFDFRRLAREELAKYSRVRMARLASELATGVDPRRYRVRGAPGLRAQLFNVRTRRLEMDFRFEGDRTSFHVLNAVSPAFTCAMPFTRFLFDRIDEQLA
jgi:L-2-hydroxyglutarate oxidase